MCIVSEKLRKFCKSNLKWMKSSLRCWAGWGGARQSRLPSLHLHCQFCFMVLLHSVDGNSYIIFIKWATWTFCFLLLKHYSYAAFACWQTSFAGLDWNWIWMSCTVWMEIQKTYLHAYMDATCMRVCLCVCARTWLRFEPGPGPGNGNWQCS